MKMSKMSNIFTAMIRAGLLAALLVVICTFTAFAEKEEKDYNIPDASWKETETRIFAEWEKPESSTSFTVTLYKLKSTDDSLKKITSQGTGDVSYDFTAEIIANGSGRYQFFIRPKKGKKENGKYSDVLEVEGSFITAAKKGIKEELKAADPYYEKAYNADGTLKYVSMKVNEGNIPDGNIRDMVITGAGNCDLISFATDKPYDQWVRGEKRTATVVIKAKDNYRFTEYTEYKGKLLTYVSSSGDDKTRTVVFSFTPQIKLPQVSGLYIDADNKLHWNKVPGASYYYLTLKDGNDDTIIKEKVKVNSKDISEIVDDIYSLQIYAANKTGGYVQSTTLKIDNFPEFLASGGQLTGKLVRTGSSVRYQTEDGDYLTGWQQLAGSWYFFDESGKAVGPGWWQDTVTPGDPNRAKGGSWYYFDNDHKMLANTTTPDGYKLDANGRWVQ